MRHKKSFVRVLKMHSVMPRDLRQAAEPPKISVKDFNYDVERRMQKVIEEVKQDRAGFIHTTTESSHSDSYEAPIGQNQRNLNQTG